MQSEAASMETQATFQPQAGADCHPSQACAQLPAGSQQWAALRGLAGPQLLRMLGKTHHLWPPDAHPVMRRT